MSVPQCKSKHITHIPKNIQLFPYGTYRIEILVEPDIGAIFIPPTCQPSSWVQRLPSAPSLFHFPNLRAFALLLPCLNTILIWLFFVIQTLLSKTHAQRTDPKKSFLHACPSYDDLIFLKALIIVLFIYLNLFTVSPIPLE